MSELTQLFAFGIVYVVIVLVLAAAVYVWISFVTYRALQSAKYEKAWMAWIPYARNYALADVTKDEGDKTRVLNAFEVPNWCYQFYWVIPLVLAFVGLPSGLEWILNIACSVIFAGTIYTKLYAWHDKVSEDDKRTLGIVSGIFPIVYLVILSGWKAEDTIERPAKIDVVDAPENNDAN